MRTLTLLLVSFFLTLSSQAAADPFLGDWKLNSAKSQMIDVVKVTSLGANKYTFDLGAGPETIVADGTDQPGYSGTTLAVGSEPSGAWKVVRKKDGKMQISAIWTLSPDGKTLTDNATEFDPKGSPVNFKYVYQRTAAGSGFAGEWESSSVSVDSAFVIQIRAWQGDGISFIDSAEGLTKNVKFDGKDYPTQGAGPDTTSSAHKLDPRTLEFTDKKNGKVLSTQQLSLSADRKVLTMTIPRKSGRPNVLVFDRQ